MVSVIIPTLWKSDKTVPLLVKLSRSEIINEIILIDNNPALAPENELITITKLKHVKNQENNFVNPSWNQGVRLATGKIVALVNDDIVFDFNDLIGIVQLLAVEKDISLIGLSQKPVTKGFDKPEIIPTKTRTPGFGCLMLMRKELYLEIPENLKIWYGDDYLFYFSKGKKFVIDGVHVDMEVSVTSSLSKFNSIKEIDNKIWQSRYTPVLKFRHRVNKVFSILGIPQLYQ